MNLRTVLRTYGLLRQLADDETALLNTLRGMNDSERELLVESLAPAKGVGRKRTSKKGASTSSTSRRGLPDNSMTICGKVDCGATAVNAIHDKAAGYAGYHPFVAPTTARGARNQSSPNGQQQEPAASSATGMAGAGDVVHAASGE